MDNYRQSWRWWVTIEMHIIDESFTVSMPRFCLFIYLLSSYSRKSAFQASSLEICFLNVHYLIHSGPVAIDESILKLKFIYFALLSSTLRSHSNWEVIQPCKWHKLLVLLLRKTNFYGIEFPSGERRGDVIRHAVPTWNNSIHLFTIESSSLHCEKRFEWKKRSVNFMFSFPKMSLCRLECFFEQTFPKEFPRF